MSENQFRRYLIYAIGEIILVVIGILIALQINNWNEKRKEYNQIANYAKSFAQDLAADIAMIEIIEYTANQVSYRIDSLSNYVRNKQIEDISNLNLLCLTWTQVYRPYMWNRATLDELKNSGSLKLIRNKELSKMIVEYDALSKHMDEDYYTDKDQSDNALQLLSQVVNNNYPNIGELSELFRVSTVSGLLDDVYSDPIYKEAEEYELNLISNDINAIFNAVNSYIRLQFNLKIRTQIELPQLIKDALEIIKLLEEEYDFLNTSNNDIIINQKREH
jgi:hypothetical protein